MIRTLEDATEAFQTFIPTTTMKQNYTLDRMKALMEALGNPQDKVKVIHIAGTSGKTSTAYFIRGLLESAGRRTGLTISPHIGTINERLQLDGQPLEGQRFARETEEFLGLVAKIGIKPTYYEVLMAFAYWFFAKEQVDYAIIETGLGGLLDGSNIVTREDKLCVISDIGLEHTEILGDTLSEIASQKAGIVQKHNYLITHHQSPDIMQAFEHQIQKQQGTMEVVTALLDLPELAIFQNRNLSLATAAYRYLAQRDHLPELTQETIEKVSQQTPPGRLELYKLGDKTIILDGAHNPQKLTALAIELQNRNMLPLPTLMSFVNISETVLKMRMNALKPICSKLFITSFSDKQDFVKTSLPLADMEKAAQEIGVPSIETYDNLGQSLQALLSQPEKTVLITGSLYLLRQIRPLIEALAKKP